MSGQPIALTRATLSAGGHSFDYLRAGRGAVVLLLLAGGSANEAADHLVTELARRSRVIVPGGLDCGDSFPGRLESFLEGIGVTRCAIVADGAFCPHALKFASDRPDSVTRLALILPASATEASAQASSAEQMAITRTGLFVRSLPGDAGSLSSLSEELLRFLA